MTDRVDRATRSRIMASIKGRDTGPEMAVRRYLHSLGYRYRLHVKTLPGKPDLVLKKHNLAIFVHGCFWHRHPSCFYAVLPSSRQDYWDKKLNANVERDRRHVNKLSQMGWRVIIVWECGLRHCKNQIDDIPMFIESGEAYAEWPRIPPRRAEKPGA